MEVVASLSQGRTAAGQCGLFTHKSVPVIFEPPCTTSRNIQSSAPEDGQNNCPQHVELNGIINKPLLLHLVGCLYYL